MIEPHSCAKKQFAQLMSKLWDSKRDLDAMEHKAADLGKLLRGSERNWHADISMLPVEVLGMIFEEVVALSSAHEEYRPCPAEPDKLERTVTRPELLISHVSKYWRGVAVGIPSLWTRIRLYVKQSVDLVDLYLARSLGSPLFITFLQHSVCGVPSWQVHAADYSRITATILDHMHICRRLKIRTDVPVRELLDGLGRSRAPLLEEIDLHHPRSSRGEPTFSSSSFPMLDRLELRELLTISTTMPMKNLTSLTLAGPPASGLSATAFLGLLSRLHSLSSLALLNQVVDFHLLPTTDVAEMPLLQYLMLRPGPDMSRDYLISLVETFTAPALQELILDFTNVSSPRDTHLFLRSLKCEAPRFLSLCRVTINSPFEGFKIADALAHTAPNIRELSLSRYTVDSVLMFLVHDARREAFQKLSTLRFESPHFDWDVLLSFLRRRRELGRPLQGLSSKGFGGSTGEILDGLFKRLLEACLII